jgi:DNA-binding MarR family transcriptional regulator
MLIRPEDSLGYWLFYAQRCVEYAFSEVLRVSCLEQNKPYVVTPPQWGVLALLYEHDGLTIGVISQRRGIDAPTVTGIVKRLEQSGLVERRHDRADRRVVKVYLTEEGWDSMRFLPEAVLAFHKITVQGFSADEQRDLIAKLQQIIVNIAEVGPGTGDRFGLLPEHFYSTLREDQPVPQVQRQNGNAAKEGNQ